MSSNGLQDTIDNLVIVVAAEWPEVSGNVWQTDIIETVPWTKVNLPLAVIAFEEATIDGEWGMDSDRYAQKISIYYIVNSNNAPVDGIRQKIIDMRERMFQVFNDAQNGLPHGNLVPIEVDAMRWGSSCEINQTFGSKNMTQAAGQVDVTFLIASEIVT